ncbi:MAG: hypothetical protein R3F36_07645 [Candidatus Competibacteraceae bacterium]
MINLDAKATTRHDWRVAKRKWGNGPIIDGFPIAVHPRRPYNFQCQLDRKNPSLFGTFSEKQRQWFEPSVVEIKAEMKCRRATSWT